VPLGGDIILAVEGIAMIPANAAKIRDTLTAMAPGSSYTVRVLRAGDVIELTGRLR
jgi:hypothetical protein